MIFMLTLRARVVIGLLLAFCLLSLLLTGCTHYKPDGSIDWGKEISDFSRDSAGQWPWK